MNKFSLLLFFIFFISCNTIGIKHNHKNTINYFKITSTIKGNGFNGVRAMIQVYKDSVLASFKMPIFSIPIIDIRLDNNNIFIKKINQPEDTLSVHFFSPNFKLNDFISIVFKKRLNQKVETYKNESIYLSLSNYTKTNNRYLPQNIAYSVFPFSDTTLIELEYQSVIFYK